jgi:hypothetical protein
MRQLQNSAINTDCPICYLLFGALEPFVISANESLLAKTAMMAFEDSIIIKVVYLENDAELATVVKERPKRTRGGDKYIWPLYETELYGLTGEFISNP